MQLAPVLTALTLALCAPAVQANCYYVYSDKHQLLYRSQVPPVDLTRPLHDSVPALGRQLALVFTASTANCEGTLDLLRSQRAASSDSRERAPRAVRTRAVPPAR